MLQLLGAIPTIIAAARKVSSVFHKGQEVLAEVTGRPSESSTPEELETELRTLPEDQQNRWAETMAKEVEQYTAQNERLATEIGLIDSTLTAKLSREAVDEVAILRMTTRPWTVRWMVRYILFPFFLIFIDIAQNLILAWLPFLKRWITPFDTFGHFFGVVRPPDTGDVTILNEFAQLFADGLAPTTMAGQLYIDSVPWVVSVVVSYMGLREVGKWRGHADNAAGGGAPPPLPSTATVVGKALSESGRLVGKIKSFFK